MRSTRFSPVLLTLCFLLVVAACSQKPPFRRVSMSGTDTGDCLATPCRTIGYAVGRAEPGDSIVVDSGTYHESVLVTKRLALIGHHATIDARGQSSPANGIRISGDSAAGTRVAGFTIRNAGVEGIFVVRTSRIIIQNDTVLDNDAYGPDHPLCTQLRSDCGEAIHLQSVTGSVVRGNLVRGNMGGILLSDEDGPTAYDTISDNTVIDNPKDCGITLASHWIDTTATTAVAAEVAGVHHNVVARNTSKHNGGAGIGVFAAGPGGAAWSNVIAENTSTKNGLAGLMIHSHARAQNVNGNVFRNNTLADNGIDVENPADHAPAGISLFSAVLPIQNTVVTGNRISGEHYGIVTVRVDSLTDLASNTFDGSIAEPTSVH